MNLTYEAASEYPAVVILAKLREGALVTFLLL